MALIRSGWRPSRWISLLGPDSGPLRQIFGELADVLAKLPQYTEKIADMAGSAWTAGQLVYDKATGKTHQWDGTQWLEQMFTEMQDWTPTLWQGVQRTCTITNAKYALWGRLCWVQWDITGTNAGAAGNDIYIGGLPKAPSLSGAPTLGSAQWYDVSLPARYTCVTEVFNTGFIGFIHGTSTTNLLGTTPNVTIANGDIYRGYCLYPW
jgi:hypothetical protein